MRLLIQGSASHPPLSDESVQCVVTSPPYWNLRQYAGEQIVPEWGCALGLESDPSMYVEHIVQIFREVRRVLRRDGTLWLVLGDSYAASGRGGNPPDSPHQKQRTNRGSVLPAGLHENQRQAGAIGRAWSGAPQGYKPKDLVGIPWMVAFALRADGWYLRSDIIWCLSATTRLYARTPRAEGPATIHDLVRLNPATVQLWNGERWTQVRGWNRGTSETLRLTLRSGERIIASPGHRWPLADERIVETRDLAVGDVLATTRLPEPERPTDEGIDADLAWFAGLYLAEGSRSDDAIQIAGNVHEVERHERTMAIARKYGGSAVLHAGNGDAVSVVVHGAFLDAAIRHFIAGRTALDKHLHARAWRSSNANLRALMEGYLAGDGSYDAPNDRWRLGFGNNPQLADSFRTLAARLGATLTLSPTLARMGRTATFEAYRGEWRWRASGHHNAKQRAEIVAIEPRAETEVWDIGVEDEPHLFALASGVLTHNSKPNPMPESVTDRPTKAHEYLFLLSKSERYFYDSDAIREAHTSLDRPPGNTSRIVKGREFNDGDERPSIEQSFHANGRNKRTVWTIATRPYAGAHFATYPEQLVEPCILAGTSPKACGVCGAPWERVIEKGEPELQAWSAKGAGQYDDAIGAMRRTGLDEGSTLKHIVPRNTTGWRSTCTHDDDSGTCVVLDPFSGSGTTMRVALRHGRSAIGIDISSEYLKEQAQARADKIQIVMGL